jgi:hypothetical protein
MLHRDDGLLGIGQKASFPRLSVEMFNGYALLRPVEGPKRPAWLIFRRVC